MLFSITSGKSVEAYNSFKVLKILHARLKMYSKSGMGFDDLGDYDGCNAINKSNYALISMNYEQMRLLLGVCIEQEITPQLLLRDIQNSLYKCKYCSKIDLNTVEIIISEEYSSKEIESSALVIILLMSIICIAVVCGTLLDHLMLHKGGKKFIKFREILVFFSLKRNIGKLMTIENNYFPCLNGIKTIAANTLIVLHVFFAEYAPATLNHQYKLERSTDLPHKLVLSLLSNVDVFLLISGFLVCFTTLRNLLRKEYTFTWKKYIISRLFRYTPAYYFTLLVYIFLLKHAGSGPQWPLIKSTLGVCDNYWWGNFLYLQDLFPSADYPCAGWTWSIPVDLHFHMISPVIFKAYCKNKTLGYSMCLLLMIGSMIYIGASSHFYGFSPTLTSGWSNNWQMRIIYFKPQARISPFLVGIVIGFIYLAHRHNIGDVAGTDVKQDASYGEKFEIFCLQMLESSNCRAWGYLYGISLMILSNFIVHGLDIYGEDYWIQPIKVLFLATHRFIFALGFSMVLLPVILGHCKPLKSFLEARIFSPLAKISYSLFLFHYCFIYYFFYIQKSAYLVDDYHLISNSIFFIVIGNIAAVFITLMVEFPILDLEKHYFR